MELWSYFGEGRVDAKVKFGPPFSFGVYRSMCEFWPQTMLLLQTQRQCPFWQLDKMAYHTHWRKYWWLFFCWFVNITLVFWQTDCPKFALQINLVGLISPQSVDLFHWYQIRELAASYYREKAKTGTFLLLLQGLEVSSFFIEVIIFKTDINLLWIVGLFTKCKQELV